MEVLAAGIDVGEGSEQVTLHPGTQQVSDPITTNVGTVRDGEQIQVVETVTELDSGVTLVVLTKTMTCHLDASGNGSCS